jgi:hypothetical protein
MNTNINRSTFTVSLALTAHSQAEQFRSRHSNSSKAKQVYLNTLAVYATNYYLQCLGWQTNLQDSNSWNLSEQTLMDVADLMVKDCGRLECRPILPQTSDLCVPPETSTDRIAYVAVRLDESLRNATLLGFVERVPDGKLALEQLRSLCALPGYLNQLKLSQNVTHLSQWLKNIFETGWQAASLLSTPQPALNFRSGDSFMSAQIETPSPTVSRSKLLDLIVTGEQILLVVGLLPLAEREREIWLKLSPTNNQSYLPCNLQLAILNEMGEAIMQATAKKTESILLKFSGEVGEYFRLKIDLDDFSFIEAFTI